ncbi:hypothetical protein BGZ81_005710, partial [Podila clonocystis]
MHFKYTSFLLLIALLLGSTETVALQANTNVNMALTPGAYSGLIPSKANENDFLMALGYFPSKAIQTAASANSNKLFAIADFEFTPPVGNIVSVLYSEDQIGYLAGLLAGEVAKSRGGKVA